MEVSTGDIKRLVGNMFFGFYDYLQAFFLTVDSFNERVRIEWSKEKLPVYIPELGFNIFTDFENKNHIIVIDPKSFKEFRENLLEIGESEDIRKVKNFMKKFLEKELSSLKFLERNKEKLREGKHEYPIILLDCGSLFHVFNDFETVTSKSSLIRGLEILNKISNKDAGISNKEVQELTRQIVSNLQLSLSRDQKKVIEEVVKNTVVAIEGVPGSGKTKVLALILILSFLIFDKFLSRKKINILFTTNTYFAMKEFLRKLLEFLKNKQISSLLRGLHIYIGINEKRIKEFSELISDYTKLKDQGIFIDKLIKRYDLEDPSLKGRFNLIVFPLSKFRAYWGKSVSIKANIDVLAVDEASQVGAVSFIELLRSITNVPERFIITGDTSQLPPIYSVGNAEIPLYTIGILYNLFTFLDGKYKLVKLNETRRLRPEITEILSNFYDGDIHSGRKEQRYIKIIDSQLRKILHTENLADIPLIRIKYYPEKHETRKSSEDEKEIAKYIVKSIECEKVALMTPFREQESLLNQIKNKNIRNAELVIGTVDKLQGQDVDVGIFSLATSHPKYTSKILSFIAVPNRLNVAFSRAKETNILIHSDSVEKELFSAFDSEKIEKAREVIIGFKRFGREIETEDKVTKYIKAVDSSKGYEILRDFIKKTQRKIGELNIPEVKGKIEVYIS